MKPRIKLPSQNELKKLFKYHRDGYLIRLKPTGRSTKAGSVVKGSLHHSGYRYVRINNKVYGIHRVIFKMLKGFVPDILDHKDRNKQNNKIGNIRPSTSSKNSHNTKTSTRNASGVKGLSWENKGGYWVGYISIKNKRFKTGFSKDKNKVIEKLNKLRKEKLKGHV